MASLASLLINVGVRLDGSLKVEQKVRRLKATTKDMADAANSYTRRFALGFRKMGANVGNKVNGLVEKFGGLHKVGAAAFAGLATAAAAAAVGIFKFVDGQTAALDNTNKMAAALGIGVEEMQRLDFVAGQSGVSASGLQKAIKKLNDRVLEFSKGSATRATETFKELGVTFEDLKGKTATEQLGVVADALNKVEDKARRSALAATLLGKNAGPELQSLLASGSEGIRDLASQAQVMTKEQADAASTFQDRMGELRNEIGAVVTQLAVDLIPMVQGVIVWLREWISENRHLIKQGLAAVLSEIAYWAGVVRSEFRAIANVMGPVNTAFDSFGVKINVAATALDVIRGALRRVMSPMRTFGDDLQGIVKWAERIGLIAPEVAGQLALIIGAVSGKNKEEIFELIDSIRAKGASMRPKVENRLTQGTSFGSFNNAPGTDIKWNNLNDKPKGGGGGKPPKGATPPKDEVPPGITLEQVRRELYGGNFAVVEERLRQIAAATPGASDIKPTVAMTVTINNLDNDFHIESVDPMGAAVESKNQIKRLLAETALSTSNNVVR